MPGTPRFLPCRRSSPAPFVCDEPQERIPRKGSPGYPGGRPPSTDLSRLVLAPSSMGCLRGHHPPLDDWADDDSVITSDIEIEAIEARLRALKFRKAHQIAVECSLLRSVERGSARDSRGSMARPICPPASPKDSPSRRAGRGKSPTVGGPIARGQTSTSPLFSHLGTPRPRSPSPSRVCDDLLRMPDLRPSPKARVPQLNDSQVSMLSLPAYRGLHTRCRRGCPSPPRSSPRRLATAHAVGRSPELVRGRHSPQRICPLAECIGVRRQEGLLSHSMVSSGTQTPRRRSRSRTRRGDKLRTGRGYRDLLLGPLRTS